MRTGKAHNVRTEQAQLRVCESSVTEEALTGISAQNESAVDETFSSHTTVWRYPVPVCFKQPGNTEADSTVYPQTPQLTKANGTSDTGLIC